MALSDLQHTCNGKPLHKQGRTPCMVCVLKFMMEDAEQAARPQTVLTRMEDWAGKQMDKVIAQHGTRSIFRAYRDWAVPAILCMLGTLVYLLYQLRNTPVFWHCVGFCTISVGGVFSYVYWVFRRDDISPMLLIDPDAAEELL